MARRPPGMPTDMYGNMMPTGMPPGMMPGMMPGMGMAPPMMMQQPMMYPQPMMSMGYMPMPGMQPQMGMQSMGGMPGMGMGVDMYGYPSNPTMEQDFGPIPGAYTGAPTGSGSSAGTGSGSSAGTGSGTGSDHADVEAGKHVSLSEKSLSFEKPSGKPQVKRIKMKNLSDSKRIAFKVQTNKPDVYLVNPCKGVLCPGKTEMVEIEMRETLTTLGKDKGQDHRFNVITMPFPESKKSFDPALWDKQKKSDTVQTVTIRVEPYE